ncbi:MULTISPECIES: ATP-binding protein [unclassified Arthrobacter]|uniref:ATP-binding protein n=1 Tax=unclassified Arthrobacter TaxID=235627 RepID=UPI003396F991
MPDPHEQCRPQQKLGFESPLWIRSVRGDPSNTPGAAQCCCFPTKNAASSSPPTWSSPAGEPCWGTTTWAAAAIIDRLVHHGRLLQFRGESYRVKNALMK